MEWNDVVDVLTAAAALDRREVTETEIEAWRATMASAGVASRRDALQSVAEHYAESRHRIMPADVIERVKAMRSARVRGLDDGDFTPDIGRVDGGEDARAYLDTLRARRALVMDGVPLADAIARVPRPPCVPISREWARLAVES